MTDLFSLRGHRALITGGTRGIGRAIALRFAAAGASVVANYVRDDKAAADLVGAAKSEGTTIETCRADVTSAQGLGRLFEMIDSQPAVSIFIHCAATGVHRPYGQLSARHFDWTYSLNVRAFFELTQRLLPRMIAGASILAISSEGADRAVPQYSLVGSSKAALESLVRHLAVELAPKGIRVNSLSAGTVLTGAWDVLPNRDHRLAEDMRRSPIGRLNTADEIAWAAQFLCSRAASGVIGHTLVVDGGLRIVA